MRKITSFLGIFIVLALALAACSTGTGNESNNETGAQTPGVLTTNIPNTGATASSLETPTSVFSSTSPLTGTSVITGTPIATSTPSIEATTAVTGTPSAAVAVATQLPLTNRAQIVPDTGRPQATRLSNLMQYHVEDKNGNTLGTVNDYILNMCEAHILYIVLNPDSTLGVSGKQILIPFEAVTLGGGKINVDQKAIVLNLDSSVVSGAPAYDIANLDLVKVDWEYQVQAYWSNYVKLSLTSICQVPPPKLIVPPNAAVPSQVTSTVQVTGTVQTTGTMQTPSEPNMPIDQVGTTKLALASTVLSHSLVDGNGNILGTVQEMVLVPESGLLRYVVVQLDPSLQAGQKIVLVPIRAINVQHEMAGKTSLVLLVKTDILKNAPQFNNNLNNNDTSWDQAAFNYWSQYVPLQKQSQP